MNIFICMVLTGFLSGCQQSPDSNINYTFAGSHHSSIDTIPERDVGQRRPLFIPGNLFTRLDAEKILGESAHLADSATTLQQDTLEYKCAYTANATDIKTGKTGNIYIAIEQYARVSLAREVYESIRKSNAGHTGVKTLRDLGDEAYFHSDGQNFYFILARKADKMLRMKVNKLTSNTSLEAFHGVAKKMMAAF